MCCSERNGESVESSMESLYEDVVERPFAGWEATERVKPKVYSVHAHLVIVINTAFTNRQFILKLPEHISWMLGPKWCMSLSQSWHIETSYLETCLQAMQSHDWLELYMAWSGGHLWPRNPFKANLSVVVCIRLSSITYWPNHH